MIGSPMSFSPRKVGQRLLALNLGKLAEVSIPPEKVEGVIDQPVLSARGEVGLEFGEVGPSFMNYDHLTVDDRLPGDIQGAGYGREPLDPGMPVPRKRPLLSGIGVELDAVAIVFDFVKPVPFGSFGLQGGELGLDESGIAADAAHPPHKRHLPELNQSQRPRQVFVAGVNCPQAQNNSHNRPNVYRKGQRAPNSVNSRDAFGYDADWPEFNG